MIPFARMCVNASKKLHNYMFSTMIKSIMRFFDTSSSGTISFFYFYNIHLKGLVILITDAFYIIVGCCIVSFINTNLLLHMGQDKIC